MQICIHAFMSAHEESRIQHPHPAKPPPQCGPVRTWSLSWISRWVLHSKIATNNGAPGATARLPTVALQQKKSEEIAAAGPQENRLSMRAVDRRCPCPSPIACQRHQSTTLIFHQPPSFTSNPRPQNAFSDTRNLTPALCILFWPGQIRISGRSGMEGRNTFGWKCEM